MAKAPSNLSVRTAKSMSQRAVWQSGCVVI